MSDEIGIAYQKVGGTAGALGLEFEKVATWIAVISSRTRESASSIGTSINSILARMSNMKEYGFNEEDQTKINDVAKSLSAVNISLTDTEGNFRDFGKIIDEVGSIWNTLDSRTKAYLATTLAGTRQQSRFYNLMEGYSEVTDLYTESLGAAGTSLEKFNIYQESTAGKLDKLKSIWEGFWQETIDSNTIKGVIDSLIYLADTFGNLRTILLAVGTVLAWMYGTKITAWIKTTTLATLATKGWAASWESLKASFMANPFGFILTGILAVVSVVDIFNQKQEEMKRKIQESASVAREQTQTFNDLILQYSELGSLQDKDESARQKLVAVQERIIELLGLEKDAIDLVNGSYKDQTKTLYELSIEKLKAAERDLQSAYNIARQEAGAQPRGILADTFTLRADSNNDIEKALIEKIAQQFGSHSEATLGRSTIDLTGKSAREKLELLLSVQELFNTQAKKGTSLYTQLNAEMGKYEELVNNEAIALKNLNENLALQHIALTGTREEMPETIEGLQSFKDATVEMAKEQLGLTKISDDFKNVIYDQIDRMFPSLSGVVDDTSGSLGEFGKSQQTLTKKIQSAQSEFASYGDNVKTLQTALSELSSGDLSEATLDNLVKSYKELIPYLDDRKTLQEKINDLIEKEQQKSYEDTLKETTSNLQSLNELQHKLNKSQGVSAEVMDEIISKHPELAEHLHSREALENAISDAILTQEGVQRQALTNQLLNSQTYFNEQIKGNQKLWNIIADAYGKDAQNFKSLAEAKDKTDVFLVNTIGARWKSLYGSQEEALRALIRSSSETLYTHSGLTGKAAEVARRVASDNLSSARKQLAALEAITKAINFSAKAINFKGVNLDKIKGGSGSSSSSKAAQEIYKPIIDAYQQISVELERVNALLEENSILTEQAEGSDKIALLQKRIALIKQQETALKKLNVQQEKELQVVKNSLKGMGFSFDSGNNITNYAQRLSKLTGDTAKSAEELIDRFVELSTSAIPDTNNEILQLGQSIKDINEELQGYIDNIKNLIYQAVKNKHQIERDMLNARAGIEKLISDARKAELQEDIDYYNDRLSELQNFYNRQKEIIRQEFNALKEERDEEKKQEKLLKLQERYNQVSLDNSGFYEKEKLDLQQQIADLTEEMHWDSLEKAVKAEEDRLDAEFKQKENEYNRQIEHYSALQEAGKSHNAEIQRIMNLGWSGILKYLRANSAQYQDATKSEKQQIEQAWRDTYDNMLGIEKDFWKETEKVYSGSINSILNFLKEYSSDFAELGKTQGEAYAKALKSEIEIAKNVGNVNLSLDTKPTSTGSSSSNKSSSSGGSSKSSTPTPPKSNYKGDSIVDYLKSIGWDSSMANRRKLSGLGSSYKGTAAQNAALLKKLRGFKDGGLVDYTGLAVMHGSKTKPEAVLDAKQTSIFKEFTKAMTVSAKYLQGSSKTPSLAGASSAGGDLIIKAINISVEKLDKDADFDLLARKVGDSFYKMVDGTQFSIPRRR